MENRGRIKHSITGKVRGLGDLLVPIKFTNLSEGVKKVPEGGAVHHGVVDGAANEKAAVELRDLHDNQGFGMTGVAKGVIELKEFSKVFRDITIMRMMRLRNSNKMGICMNEQNSGIVAEDVNVAVRVSMESTGECGEVGEGSGEGVLEESEERGGFKGGMGEQDPLLDIVTRQHGKIRDGEF